MGIFDFLGGKNESVKNTNVDPNAFQYGGRQGAAQEEADYYGGQSQATDERGAPLADYSQANNARQQQQSALDLARSAAFGQQPSVAQIQQQQGTERAIGDQLAAAAGARGTGSSMAAAQRSAMQQGSAMSQQAVAQNAALRAQEMADARNSFAAQTQGLRGQDLGAAQFQAQQQLASRNANDARAMQQEQFRQGVQGMQMGAQQNYAQLQSGIAGANAQNDRSNAMGVIGAVGSVLSDVRAKDGISAVSAPGGGGAMLATGGGEGGLTAAPGGGGLIPIAGASLSGIRSNSLANSRMGPQEGAPSGEREKPPSAQEIKGQIKDASRVDMKPTTQAAGGAGWLGGNAGLFGPGGLFGAKTADNSVPTSTMTKPSDALMGFLGGAQSVYSDERAKASTAGGRTADALLDTLRDSAATYNYRDPSLEPRNEPTGGKYLGVMAQDLERVPGIGRQLVSDSPNGLKAVESGPALSAVMGGLGRITERLERLERKGKGGPYRG